MLIVVQNCAVVVAAVLYATMAKRRVPSVAAFVLVLAFLASRKSHSAFISTFYPESLEPALILGFVLAAQYRRWLLYWCCVLLALGCKEDVALYVVSYGLVLAISRSTRRQGALTALVAAAWLAVAVGVAIPQARAHDGLPSENPFWVGRYGPSPVSTSLARVASQRSLAKFVNLSAATGFLAWLDPATTALVLPGVAVNLAADSATLQSGLVGHYLWPMLPFLFLAALEGYARVARWNKKVAYVWLSCLAALTLLDSPIRPASILKEASEYSAAMAVRRQLWGISAERVVLAQPQLIPHLEKRPSIQAIGKRLNDPLLADDVLLCPIGDQWPLGQTGFTEEVNRYTNDPRYQTVDTGTALVHFRLRH